MASINRLGRAVSSGKTASDKSRASRASVSSAVRSNRLEKSDNAVPVVIKNSSRSIWPDNRLWHRLRQFRRHSLGRLKRVEKSGKYQWDIDLEPETIEFAHCPEFVAGRFGRVVAALSVGAVLSRRPSGLGADGLALGDGCPGVAAMDRF